MERVSISSGLDGMLSFEAAMAQKTAPGHQVLCYICPRQEPELGLVSYSNQTGCDGGCLDSEHGRLNNNSSL